MRTLYLDCSMGAAGDMLAAALLEIMPDPASVLCELNALQIPDVSYEAQRCVKCGIEGTRMVVRVRGVEESGERSHEEEGHSHGHCGLAQIRYLVCERLSLPEKVAQDVLDVFDLVAQAEGKVHGKPVTDIHFHELGTMDAVADIVAVCMLMDRLRPDRVAASAVHVGRGQVRCAHGILPVPAPATACILQGIPIYGKVEGELCTPTGAALLRHFVDEFGDMPAISPEAIGYGMGMKDFEAANCVRAMIGRADVGGAGEDALELVCNIDDMSPEALAFASEELFAAGALDVFTIPAAMKKSRLGSVFCVICRPQDRKLMTRLMFRHTTTIGIREHALRRHVLDRRIETRDGALGPVRVKVSEGFGLTRRKYEYDDLAAIAKDKNMSLEEVAESLRD